MYSLGLIKMIVSENNYFVHFRIGFYVATIPCHPNQLGFVNTHTHTTSSDLTGSSSEEEVNIVSENQTWSVILD